MKIGEYLKELRFKRRVTLRKLSEETGFSNAYLSQVENDKIKSPSARVIHRLAEYYSIDPKDLINPPENENKGHLKPDPAISAKGTLISDFFSPEDVHKLYMEQMKRNREYCKEQVSIRSHLMDDFGDYGRIQKILFGKGHLDTDVLVKAVIFYYMNETLIETYNQI